MNAGRQLWYTVLALGIMAASFLTLRTSKLAADQAWRTRSRGARRGS